MKRGVEDQNTELEQDTSEVIQNSPLWVSGDEHDVEHEEEVQHENASEEITPTAGSLHNQEDGESSNNIHNDHRIDLLCPSYDCGIYGFSINFYIWV